METLAILLSGLLVAGSPIGLIVEKISGDRLQQRLNEAETFEVRIDNIPAHQIAQGKIDRVRIASRDLELIAGLTFAELELETDPLNFDLQGLRQGKISRQTLREPLQAGIRFVLTAEDLNVALQSPRAKARLQPLINRLLTPPDSPKPIHYQLNEITIDFLENNRFELTGAIATVNPQTGETATSTLKLAYTVQLASGTTFQLIEPEGLLNGEPLAERTLENFGRGVSSRFDFQRLEEQGLTLRFFSLDLDAEQLETALFLRFEP